MKLLLGRDHQGASRLHQENAGLMQQLEAARPLEIEVLELAGFHRKNTYLVQHWQAIQAGRGPEDPVLLEAERKFFEALLVDPTDAACLDGLASVLILERELDAAAFFETRAIRQSARDALDYDAAWHNLKLIRQHKPSAPIPSELGEGPGSAGAIMAADRYCEKAGRHQAAGRHVEALADYERALVNDPKRVEAHVGRGQALLRLQRADEALDAMAVAVRVGPDSPDAHSALAAALIQVGRLREGLESADRALELAPGFPQALYYKACGYSLLEEGDEALNWLRRAIEAHPSFREQAREEPHFERLRKDPELAAGFAELVEG